MKRLSNIKDTAENELSRNALSVFYKYFFLWKIPQQNAKTYFKPGKKFHLQKTQYVLTLDGAFG